MGGLFELPGLSRFIVMCIAQHAFNVCSKPCSCHNSHLEELMQLRQGQKGSRVAWQYTHQVIEKHTICIYSMYVPYQSSLLTVDNFVARIRLKAKKCGTQDNIEFEQRDNHSRCTTRVCSARPDNEA